MADSHNERHHFPDHGQYHQLPPGPLHVQYDMIQQGIPDHYYHYQYRGTYGQGSHPPNTTSPTPPRGSQLQDFGGVEAPFVPTQVLSPDAVDNVDNSGIYMGERSVTNRGESIEKVYEYGSSMARFESELREQTHFGPYEKSSKIRHPQYPQHLRTGLHPVTASFEQSRQNILNNQALQEPKDTAADNAQPSQRMVTLKTAARHDQENKTSKTKSRRVMKATQMPQQRLSAAPPAQTTSTALPVVPPTTLRFKTRQEAIDACAQFDWSYRSPDPTIPTTDGWRRVYVLGLLIAMKNRTDTQDKTGARGIHLRWMAKYHYDEAEMEKVCWDIVHVAERLHTEGPSSLSLYDPDTKRQMAQEKHLSFYDRLNTLIGLLSRYKARCDSLMKGGSMIEDFVAAPLAKLKMSEAYKKRGRAKAEKGADAVTEIEQISEPGEFIRISSGKAVSACTEDALQGDEDAGGGEIPQAPLRPTPGTTRKRAREIDENYDDEDTLTDNEIHKKPAPRKRARKERSAASSSE